MQTNNKFNNEQYIGMSFFIKSNKRLQIRKLIQHSAIEEIFSTIDFKKWKQESHLVYRFGSYRNAIEPERITFSKDKCELQLRFNEKSIRSVVLDDDFIEKVLKICKEEVDVYMDKHFLLEQEQEKVKKQQLEVTKELEKAEQKIKQIEQDQLKVKQKKERIELQQKQLLQDSLKLEKQQKDLEDLKFLTTQKKLHEYKIALSVFYGNKCCYCDSKLPSDFVHMTLDHIVPKSKGGKDEIGNFLLSCQPCNSKKSSLNLNQFLNKDQKKRFIKEYFHLNKNILNRLVCK